MLLILGKEKKDFYGDRNFLIKFDGKWVCEITPKNEINTTVDFMCAKTFELAEMLNLKKKSPMIEVWEVDEIKLKSVEFKTEVRTEVIGVV